MTLMRRIFADKLTKFIEEICANPGHQRYPCAMEAFGEVATGISRHTLSVFAPCG